MTDEQRVRGALEYEIDQWIPDTGELMRRGRRLSWTRRGLTAGAVTLLAGTVATVAVAVSGPAGLGEPPVSGGGDPATTPTATQPSTPRLPSPTATQPSRPRLPSPTTQTSTPRLPSPTATQPSRPRLPSPTTQPSRPRLPSPTATQPSRPKPQTPTATQPSTPTR